MLAITFGAAIPAAAAANAPCPDLMPPEIIRIADRRALEPTDLVRLRDIGPAEASSVSSRLFTLSPDGARLAFQLRRADPERNSHCLGMFVLDLRPGARPRLVDSGGALIRMAHDFRGKAGFPTGVAAGITPRWSPDGRWIAFLKRERGTVQVWRAPIDGGGSAALTSSSDDVEDFRILSAGRALLFTTRPGHRAALGRIEDEGRGGFHFDDRFAPMSGDRPFPMPTPKAAQILDLASGEVRPAAPEEAALMDAPPDVAEGLWSSALSPDGKRAFVEEGGFLDPEAASLHLEQSHGRRIQCMFAECAGASSPWWTADSRRVRFQKREGPARSVTAIYEWAPEQGSVARLYATTDRLVDCAPAGDALICLREGSNMPRRLEWLEPASGARSILFDPNPEYAGLTLGQTERLHWTNDAGLETVGDLVLPVRYRAGRRYPLIVVQYDTRGLLRGGTGDEYPIQAFANRGFAVLSLSRPLHFGLNGDATSILEAERANLEGFADRRSVLSSVERGVQMLIDRGIADPDKIGITGFSDGASTVTFALLHSSLFAAAAMSNCCIDTSLPIRVGPRAAREFHDIGYPRMIDRADDFWSQISLSRNARSVRTPILLQLADSEYLSALESYTALREAGAPVDMYVFPDEHHVKWQPAHRLAAYERSLDWFDYWLRGRRSEAPLRQAELSHWDSLRHDQPAPQTD